MNPSYRGLNIHESNIADTANVYFDIYSTVRHLADLARERVNQTGLGDSAAVVQTLDVERLRAASRFGNVSWDLSEMVVGGVDPDEALGVIWPTIEAKGFTFSGQGDLTLKAKFD